MRVYSMVLELLMLMTTVLLMTAVQTGGETLLLTHWTCEGLSHQCHWIQAPLMR